MGKIQLENDIFERESKINKRLIRFDDKAMSIPGVMYAPTPGEDEEEDKEEEGNTQLTPPMAQSVDDGAAWRLSIPEETNYPWWCIEKDPGCWSKSGPDATYTIGLKN
ncbi:hypothetical protein O3P69_019908 [Scylla paramamosain]|uniref:Uncharacterized protein n=1 Tax=Scylla paramamosain TaxID=85552 RepID=A0AAW0SBV0_SCYPA